MSNKMRSILIKMIIVGECETGKTFLCKKLTNNHIINGYIATIGLDMYVLRKQLNNIEAKIHLWDTSGSPSYFNIIKSYFNACCASIIIIDLSNKNCFKNMTKWICELKDVKRNDNEKIIISVFADTSGGIYGNHVYDFENYCKKEKVYFYKLNLFNDDVKLNEKFDEFFEIINKNFIFNGNIVHGINYYLDKDITTIPLLNGTSGTNCTNGTNGNTILNKTKNLLNCCSIM